MENFTTMTQLITDHRDNYIIVITILFASLFPLMAYLTFRLRDRVFILQGIIRELHLRVRGSFLLNQEVVDKLKKEDKLPKMSPTQYNPPLLADDAKKTGNEIADEEKKEKEKKEDHTEQLMRIIKELKTIYDACEGLSFASGLNLALLIVAVFAAIVGIVTAETGVGLIIAILAILFIIIDIIKKIVESNAEDKLKKRARELEEEVKKKEEDLKKKLT
jgi:hypothetical protein